MLRWRMEFVGDGSFDSGLSPSAQNDRGETIPGGAKGTSRFKKAPLRGFFCMGLRRTVLGPRLPAFWVCTK